VLKLMAPFVQVHPGGWRHPVAWDQPVMNFDYYVDIARTAERGLFDLCFAADGNAVRQVDNPAMLESPAPTDRPTGFEPLTFMAALAQRTEHIGLLCTVSTTYEEPYMVARRFASIDHLSGGRACWNIVTGSFPGDALNFSRDEHVDKASRYARAREFVEVTKGLWDSWADDAFIQDKASGRFLDSTRVHTLNHVGENFAVRGPLNVSRSPQGYPVLFQAGQSEDGRELTAQHADCALMAVTSMEESLAVTANIRDRMDKYDRAPDSLKFFPGIVVYLGRSQAEADELYDEVSALISTAQGVANLGKLLAMDLSGYPLDGPLPEPPEYDGITSLRNMVVDMARRENLTIRQTYERVLGGTGYPVAKGGPIEVADVIEEWYTSGACDGIGIGVPIQPKCLHDFVDLVVPELQRRGIYRTEYTGATLRENLDLPTPKNPYFA
jgi:alkanesulfonate monooxygenase